MKEKHANRETKCKKVKDAKKATKKSKKVKKHVTQLQEDDCIQETKKVKENEDTQERGEDLRKFYRAIRKTLLMERDALVCRDIT